MKLLLIIDSLELNGGSSMFLEMVTALRRYYPECKTETLVVSKTGYYGRARITDNQLMGSYGVFVPCMSYEDFDKVKKKICKPPGTIVVHHRLGCTRPLKVKCPYVVINHTIEYPHRMKKFRHAQAHISVCEHVRRLTNGYYPSEVILNGVENDYISDIPAANLAGKFKTGRCHRLTPSKFNRRSLDFLEQIGVKDHYHYLIGPAPDHGRAFKQYPSTKYLGAVFDRKKKIGLIKALDVYFYDSRLKEGASIAILEALACGVPVVCRARGGNKELIQDGVNGFFIEDPESTRVLLKRLSKPEFLNEMKEKVRKDFDSRLHIRHRMSEYMNMFLGLINE